MFYLLYADFDKRLKTMWFMRELVLSFKIVEKAVSILWVMNCLLENKIIETVKKQYSQKHNEEYAISFIECGLNISPEEAKEIFEKEILGAELIS